MYPFQVTGRTIEVCPYRVDYTVEIPPEEDGGDMEMEELSRLFRTRKAAERFAGRVGRTVAENDTSAYAWMDGLQVPADVTSPMDAAVRMAEMGQEPYLAQQEVQKAAGVDQLRADVDYLSIMTGVTL